MKEINYNKYMKGNSFASVTVDGNMQANGIANISTIQDFYSGDILGFYLNGVSTFGLVAQFQNV